MKTHLNLGKWLFFLTMLAFASCQKDTHYLQEINDDNALHSVHSTIDDDQIATRGRKEEEVVLSLSEANGNFPLAEALLPCQPTDRYFRITIHKNDGSFPAHDHFCYSEEELIEALESSGVDQATVSAIIQTVFHSDQCTPLYINYVGGLLEVDANGTPFLTINPTYDLTCYIAYAGQDGTYQTPVQGGPPYQVAPPACPEGTIESITLGNSQPSFASLCAFALTGSNQNITLINKCTNQFHFIDFDINPGANVYQALIASGLSASQAESIRVSLISGQYSARAFYNLFQYRVVPHLTSVQNLPNYYLELNCYILRGVAMAVSTNALTTVTQYVYGDGQLYCGVMP
ncbi:MAG: hypothetical protein IPN76_32355 [Saprospiraceae bacterium]|nr:hypothetical protein [Saprospiraceae bacterium]